MAVFSAVEKLAGRFVDDAYHAAGLLIRHVKPSEIKGTEGLMVLGDKIAQVKIGSTVNLIDRIGTSGEKITKLSSIFEKMPDLPDGSPLPFNADNITQLGKVFNNGLEGISTTVRLVEGEVNTIAAQRHAAFEAFSAGENSILNGDITQYIKELEKRMKDYNKKYRLVFEGTMCEQSIPKRSLPTKEDFTGVFNFLKQKASKVYEKLTPKTTCLDPAFV